MEDAQGRLTPEERIELRLLVASLCAWEAVAITTRAVPTLSHGMWRLPRPIAWALWAFVIAFGTDHFFIRRFT